MRIRTFFAAWTLAVVATLAFAQDKPKVQSKTAVITESQKAAYWKAFAQKQGAQKQLESANEAVKQAVQAMVAACGPESTLIQAANGDPECATKPAEAPKAAK